VFVVSTPRWWTGALVHRFQLFVGGLELRRGLQLLVGRMAASRRPSPGAVGPEHRAPHGILEWLSLAFRDGGLLALEQTEVLPGSLVNGLAEDSKLELHSVKITAG